MIHMRTPSRTAHALCPLVTLLAAALCLADTPKQPERVLRHAAFFKFKDGTSSSNVAKVLADFAALSQKIDAIKGYQAGENISPLGSDDGYTHCFLVTLDDEAGRKKYFRHPADKEFGRFMRPLLEKVFVIDYWGKPAPAPDARQLKFALFLKFNASATAEQIKDAEEKLAQLPSQCEAVRTFEWGRNNSPEKYSEGFTHCFMFTFDNAAGAKSFLDSPAYKSTMEQLSSVAQKTREFEFWTKSE